jgi:hypothetical protein
MSNIPHVPTPISRELVKSLVALGEPQEKIADIIDIDEKTLRKHYREELDHSLPLLLSRVANTAYKKALDGDPKMIELVLKCRARWSAYKPPEEEKKTTTDTLLETLIDKL